MTADYGSRALTARDYSRALTERLPAHERMRTPHNMLDLYDATVGDRSLVIMASYEREPETSDQTAGSSSFLMNVAAFKVCQPPFSDARMVMYLLLHYLELSGSGILDPVRVFRGDKSRTLWLNWTTPTVVRVPIVSALIA